MSARLTLIGYLVGFLLLLFACQPSTNKKVNQKIQQESSSKYPKPEMGITLVNKDGWDDNTMQFQLNYCMESFSQLQDIDPLKFCDCFLQKVQYYYEPIYVKDSYTDQKKWNGECMEAATTK